MSDKLRLFIAVRFSDEVRENLARMQERLRHRLPPAADIKWVPPANIHLTLQFLGNVDAGLLPKLAGSLNGAYDDVAPFTAELAGLGAFPSPRRARVIWAGMRHGADGLRALHAATLRVTEGFGFEPEKRPFKAHVTLGRARSRKRRQPGPDISAALEPQAEVEIGKCQIGAVHLVKSELKPQGPEYSNLDSFPVGG
jgi:RNA 2',3'-cyclic 3'-phosphodiesterase